MKHWGFSQDGTLYLAVNVCQNLGVNLSKEGGRENDSQYLVYIVLQKSSVIFWTEGVSPLAQLFDWQNTSIFLEHVTPNVSFTFHTGFMQWSAAVSQIFGGEKRGQALQLLSGVVGLIGMAYGLQVLMVERATMPICSAELLTAVGEQSFLKQQQLTVEVAGAVVQPGVWQLAVGARVAEAIEKAGGFSTRADRTFAAQGINLARPIDDGEQIYVPFEGENAVSSPQQTAAVLDVQTGGVSINTASAEELDALPGIGAARAADIIENRPYTGLDELVSREVLTEAIFKDIEGLIVL